MYNSRLYSDNELQNILSHERIHSREKHSFDILISKIFCVVFWFNPFVWLYKKSLIQNLEYIADQKAIQNTNDKKAYQITLLKVVSNQNCFTITNSFYQALIKKRIVMLNKTQSKKWNVWKYALIIPSLVTFVILFQVKVVAQERQNTVNQLESSQGIIKITIDKNTTDEEIKNNIEKLENDANVECNISKIKRNSKGEITAIRIDYKDKVGKKGTSIIDGDEPIGNLTIFRTKNSIEISSNDKKNEVYETAIANEEVTDLVEFTDLVSEKTANIEINDNDFPTPPTPPTPPTFNFNAPKAPNFPTAPRAPKGSPEKGDKKEWATFEQKMKAFDKKMEAMAPQMKEFDKKMAEFDEQMKPFDAKMKIFEKNMKIYEKQMEEYREKMNEN